MLVRFSVYDCNHYLIQEVARMEQSSMTAYPTGPATLPEEKVLGQSMPSYSEQLGLSIALTLLETM